MSDVLLLTVPLGLGGAGILVWQWHADRMRYYHRRFHRRRVSDVMRP